MEIDKIHSSYNLQVHFCNNGTRQVVIQKIFDANSYGLRPFCKEDLAFQ